MARLGSVASVVWWIGSALMFAGQAAAQQAPKAPPAQTAAPKPGTSPSPDATTASFGDWTLRCDRRLDVTPPQRFCELAHVVQKPGESAILGQLAVGRVGKGDPLKITAVLPVSVALKILPKLVADRPEPLSVELTWTRCVVGACFSDVTASDEILKRLRALKEPARIEYRDGTDREASLPISFRGFGEALDALAHEPAN